MLHSRDIVRNHPLITWYFSTSRLLERHKAKQEVYLVPKVALFWIHDGGWLPVSLLESCYCKPVALEAWCILAWRRWPDNAENGCSTVEELGSVSAAWRRRRGSVSESMMEAGCWCPSSTLPEISSPWNFVGTQKSGTFKCPKLYEIVIQLKFNYVPVL